MSRDETPRSGGVQSVERSLRLLDLMADAGGEITLGELAERTRLPPPTVHRLLTTLVHTGHVHRRADRRYALGARLLRLGEAAGRMLGTRALPWLAELSATTGETANLAVLEGNQLVYVAQSPSARSMRMFTEVGRRVDAHSTAVGKAVLATLPEEQAVNLVRGAGMRAQTEHTITSVAALRAELRRVRETGRAVDAQEQEIGVRCMAVAVPAATPPAAVSVSGPEERMRRADEVTLREALRQAADAVGRALRDA